MIESTHRSNEAKSFLTSGGTAVDASGNRMNIEIPTLRGAALHYPRRAASGFMATIGTMNDL
jgi:hypothetical protein